jgi:cysteine desulfurase
VTSAVYLDHNATSPIDPRVQEAMVRCAERRLGSPSSRDHAFGWRAADAVEEARAHVAALIGAAPHEIVFTSGATESVNLALGVPATGVLATCVAEHETVRAVGRRLMRSGHQVNWLPLEVDGVVAPTVWADALASLPPGSLVALMGANNEIGTIQPVGAVAALARERGATVMSDLTQAIGRVPVDVSELGVNLAAFSAHKFHGPMGVGALYCRAGAALSPIEPVLIGGSQEWGLRAGTPNVPGIVGFGEACRIARSDLPEESERITRLRDVLEQAITAEVPDAWINGVSAARLPNTSSIGVRGIDARTLIREMRDVACSTRSACASARHGPSHVLKAIGLSDDDAYSCIRLSLGRFTTQSEIDVAIDRVVSSVTRLRRARTSRHAPA